MAVVAPAGGLAATGHDTETGPRSYLQRSYTKMRPGSYLKGDQGAPIATSPELRTALERQRDVAVAKHFARMAELDVISEVSRVHHDTATQERSEDVRRKEVQRFFVSLQVFKAQTWRQFLGELP